MRKFEVTEFMRESQIRIKVKVPDMCREFNFKLYKKTRVKEIIIRLCELLDIDPLRTEMFLFAPFGFNEMNHTSTLVQNGIEDGMAITAKIHYTDAGSKMNTLYKVVSKKTQFGNSASENFVSKDNFPVYDLKGHVDLFGLKVTGVCINPYCLAYNKEVTFPLGTGTFDINSILTNTRCQTCPYKDRNAQKPIKVKSVSLVNCCWMLKGHYVDMNGFTNYKYSKNWFRTEGSDNTKLYDLLRQTNYLDPEVIVKVL